MREEVEHIGRIREYQNLLELKGLWDKIKSGTQIDSWPSGKAFEYLILRAFELDSDSQAHYPYSVDMLEFKIVEQIDGFVQVPKSGISAIVESKDLDENVGIAPIQKLKGQLSRRPANLIGCFFTVRGYTLPANLLSHFLFPQTILLWTGRDIDFCFENDYFSKGLEAKYVFALKNGIPLLDLQMMNDWDEN